MESRKPLTIPPRALLDDALRPTRAEIDLRAIEHNVREVRSLVGVPVWGVVKADAYGHGAVTVGSAMVAAGAEGLCVALVEEGIELRRAGVSAPILVLSGAWRDGLDEALEANLTPLLYDPSQLEELKKRETPVSLHLKVDTGMARLGITENDWTRVAQALKAMPHVRVQGLMTHFACADEDDRSFTEVQLERFAKARSVLRAEGIDPPVLHAANSAGAFRFEEARFSLVRVGIALYGVAPFAHAGPGLLPAFRLRTEVIAVRELPQGASAGYAATWRAARKSLLATVPIGYADGFFRRLSSEAQVLLRGRRAPVVGNVSMDMTMIDVTDIVRKTGPVRVGEEVVLLGAQRGEDGTEDIIRAEEIAARVGTIPYEVLTAVSRRVPRAYVLGGRRAA